jgi:hypothetical protein
MQEGERAVELALSANVHEVRPGKEISAGEQAV